MTRRSGARRETASFDAISPVDCSGNARRLAQRTPGRVLAMIFRLAALAKDLVFMPSPSEQRLSFEAPIYEVEARLGEMETQYSKNRASDDTSKIREQIRRLRRELAQLKREIYSQLDPWQTVQVSRHQQRPQRAFTWTWCSSSSWSSMVIGPSATTRRSSRGWPTWMILK
jgi:hypothetical protein